MPVTYKDAEQEREVNLIVDDLLENCRDELIRNDIVGVYQRITNSEVGQRMQGDRLGKITEVLLDLYPEMLHHIEELPTGMFYGSNLVELDLPANITKFGQGVFALSDIRKINYEGTREQWNNLTRNSHNGWDIMLPSGEKVQDIVEVNCSDAQNIYGVTIEESLEIDLNEDASTLDRDAFKTYVSEKLGLTEQDENKFNNNTWEIDSQAWSKIKPIESCLNNFKVKIQFDRNNFTITEPGICHPAVNKLAENLFSAKALENLTNILRRSPVGYTTLYKLFKKFIGNANHLSIYQDTNRYMLFVDLNDRLSYCGPSELTGDWYLRICIQFDCNGNLLTGNSGSWYAIYLLNDKSRKYTKENFDDLANSLCDLVNITDHSTSWMEPVREFNTFLENFELETLEKSKELTTIKASKETSLQVNESDYDFGFLSDALIEYCEPELKRNDFVGALKILASLDPEISPQNSAIHLYLDDPLYLIAYAQLELGIRKVWDLPGIEEFIDLKTPGELQKRFFFFGKENIKSYFIPKDLIEDFPNIKISSTGGHNIVFEDTIETFKDISVLFDNAAFMKLPSALTGEVDFVKTFDLKINKLPSGGIPAGYQKYQIIFQPENGESRFKLPQYQYDYLKDLFVSSVPLSPIKEEILQDSMTKREVIFKHNVLQYLREDGFNTFADYLSKFHFNFLTSQQAGKPFVAAIAPDKGIILVNPNVQVNGLSMLLRHEAAHQIFKHMQHMFAKLKKLGIKKPSQLAYKLANFAGDYHISNYIYDEDDKFIAKHLQIENMEEFAGLVTELDFPENPEYWTMEFDDLWDVLVKKWNVTKEQLEEKALQNPELSPDFIEGWNALVNAFKRGEITKEQLKQWYDKKLVG